MKIFFTSLFLLCSNILFAQKNHKENQLENLFKLDLGFRGIGLTYEPRLSDKMSLEFSAGLGGGYNISSSSFDYNWDFLNPAVYVIINPKLYYNRNKRLEKEKSISRNSGNYIGMAVKYTTPSVGEVDRVVNSLLFNLHWGLQRPVGKRWTFNTHFGAGYASDLSGFGGTIYPAMDLRFAYVFGYGKRKG